jgi:hypothetical protein
VSCECMFHVSVSTRQTNRSREIVDATSTAHQVPGSSGGGRVADKRHARYRVERVCVCMYMCVYVCVCVCVCVIPYRVSTSECVCTMSGIVCLMS